MSAQPQFSFSLPDLVVVSGASSGLGLALCEELCRFGVSVIGVDLAAATAEQQALNGYVHVSGDVSSEDTWDGIVAQVKASGCQRLGLVTSAAVLDVGTILDASRSDMDKAFAVNVIGTALGMKALLPLMIEAGGGPVVAIASIAGTFAEQQLSVYAASKGAVRQLARTVAMDHARQGIRVNVVSPGPMLAGLFKRHMASANDPARFEATRANRQPGGRILEAEEVARAAIFLLSDGAAAINGADLIADGGLTTSFDFRTGAEGASV